MSDSMIERVSWAICKAEDDFNDGPAARGCDYDCEDCPFKPHAYAAIAAMREPTEAMMRAADNEAAMDIWHDMIEAALDG